MWSSERVGERRIFYADRRGQKSLILSAWRIPHFLKSEIIYIVYRLSDTDSPTQSRYVQNKLQERGGVAERAILVD
jgi:hypothetical protein